MCCPEGLYSFWWNSDSQFLQNVKKSTKKKGGAGEFHMSYCNIENHWTKSLQTLHSDWVYCPEGLYSFWWNSKFSFFTKCERIEKKGGGGVFNFKMSLPILFKQYILIGCVVLTRLYKSKFIEWLTLLLSIHIYYDGRIMRSWRSCLFVLSRVQEKYQMYGTCLPKN